MGKVIQKEMIKEAIWGLILMKPKYNCRPEKTS